MYNDMLEISPVQRLRALVCLCIRMAPPLRLVKPSQRGSLHLNKQNILARLFKNKNKNESQLAGVEKII